MRKIMIAVAASTLMLSSAACTTPGERAVGGAAVAALPVPQSAERQRDGRAEPWQERRSAGGAIVGAATAPRTQCPYGTYRDAYGNLYCR